ncbi:hypothetical protein HYALB_00006086 [Hymenoscyphus albidus]|uniref:Uncharacterized protein n=1 Tax=Hymenoscyphus albidus TaxID=595503 RepID=A0A9N9M071_9HELO|nr:hypothetical protein HYALB_00006086 [Hymenoscyphus albidus]
MLDEFVPAIPEPKLAGPAVTSKPPIPTADPASLGAEGVSDDEFAKQLQEGMADLLGGLGGTSGDMQAQFEALMKELGGAEGVTGESAKDASQPASKEKAKAGLAAAATEESFQETIKKNMERLRASGDQATAAATEESGDDMLAEMMKAMQASGLDGEGSEEDLSKMLLGMMEQLTHKEILYEPMKELDDKYPSWLESNASKADKDDLKRYKEQQVYVREIVGRFEKKGYSDDNVADREYIVDRMQKMQAAGSPPPDLVGDMAAAQEAFGAPEGCPTQ